MGLKASEHAATSLDLLVALCYLECVNDTSLVQRLAADEQTCSFFAPVLAELRRHGLDTDDLRAIIETELGETHCFKSKPTEKYHPQTISDYYTIWIDECQHRMFIKLLVATQGSSQMLIITSFKRDTSHGF